MKYGIRCIALSAPDSNWIKTDRGWENWTVEWSDKKTIICDDLNSAFIKKMECSDTNDWYYVVEEMN